MKKLLAIVTIINLIFITSCQKDDFVEIKGVCPKVISTDPSNNAVDVPINQIITVTFNEQINPATLTHSSLLIFHGSSSIDGIISYSGTTAKFIPAALLEENTTYTGRITTGIKDLRGNAIQVDYVWSFTTGTTLAPMVIATDPDDNSVNVFPSIITAVFNMPMDPLSINATSFKMKQGTSLISGTVTYSGTSAYFKPSAPLALHVNYTCTLSKEVKNTTGTPLRNDYVWTFTTGLNNAPFISSTDPANNETDVSLTKIITANFSVAMDPSSITASNFTVKEGNTAVIGLVASNGSSSTFKPNYSLKPNTTYTATISSAAKDLHGTRLQSDYVWTFSTGGTISPTIVSTDPVNNAVGVLLNKVVTANFNMPLDPSSLNSSTIIMKQGAATVTGTISSNGTSISFIPSTSLTANTLYTVTLTKGIRNMLGASLANDYTWSFTTVSPNIPLIISTDPLNNAINVSLTKAITATWNMPMDPLSITPATFEVKEGVNVVAGSVSSAGASATFTPATPLKANTVYTISIRKSVRSALGVAADNDYIWTFATVSLVAPVILSTDPINNASGVALNKVVSAVFNMPIDPLSINGTSFLLKEGTNLVVGATLYNGAMLSFTPSSALKPNTVYTAIISSSLRNFQGVQLANDHVWTFTTAALNAPIVLSTVPLNNATNVSLNQVIEANFNMMMDASTINPVTFTVKAGANVISGLVTYNGTKASFSAFNALSPNTVYTVSLARGIRSSQGIALTNDYVWTFTTASLTAPVVISTNPLNNAVDVLLNQVISVNFNMSMDPLSLNPSSFIVKEGSNIVAGLVTTNGSVATFSAFGYLKANTNYSVTITKDARNLSGISLAGDYNWSFTTKSVINPQLIDLKSAAQFGILAAASITSSGLSKINDLNVGLNPGIRSSIQGFPPAVVTNGSIYASDDLIPSNVLAILTNAKLDLTSSFLLAQGMSSPAPILINGDQGGKTYTPGIYQSSSAFLVESGNLILDAQGDPNAVWIFQITSNLTTTGGEGGNIILAGGAQAKNVFWICGNSATLGSGTSFSGNLMALNSVTLNSDASITGRLYAINGSVALTNTNIINKP